MVSGGNQDGTGGVDAGIRRLDGVLPEGIDRRTFMKTSVAAIAGGALAGPSMAQEDPFETDLVFRLPWEAEPNYTIGFAAQRRGFWEEQGIRSLTTEAGTGSGDTARRVGTGTNLIGHGGVTPQISGLAQEDFEILQFGTAKARALAAFIYRQDRFDDALDPDEYEGKSFTAATTLHQQMWPVYLEHLGASEDVGIEFAEEATSAALIEQGEVDGVFDSLDDFASLDAQLDVELGVVPLYYLTPVTGYVLAANRTWVEDTERATEYVTSVLQGYSEAGKWTLLNPDAAIDMMMEVNPALETEPRESLVENLKAGVAATNLSEGVRENGFGYLDEDVLQNTFEEIGEALGVEIPDVDDVLFRDVTEEAELATFTDEEWEQVNEFAEPYSTYYEEPL